MLAGFVPRALVRTMSTLPTEPSNARNVPKAATAAMPSRLLAMTRSTPNTEVSDSKRAKVRSPLGLWEERAGEGETRLGVLGIGGGGAGAKVGAGARTGAGGGCAARPNGGGGAGCAAGFAETARWGEIPGAGRGPGICWLGGAEPNPP